MKYLVTAYLICLALVGFGQSKNVLFLGNSYTGVNNLPQVLADLSESVEDTIVFDSNTPGGHTLQGHSANATSLAKIAQGDWDFVVLQEQSQLPSFPIGQVETETFPFAEALNSEIELHNPCAETAFYMTWGRENGDASNCDSWPPVCTYAGMDSLLHLRYMMMAEMNDAIVSPVGRVWKNIRADHPTVDLYSGDGSHPSTAGTYAAACAFYTVVFRKDPALLTYDYTISTENAEIIRNVASEVVFQNLSEWFVGTYDLTADFESEAISNTEYQFTNTSLNGIGAYWVIDGAEIEDENPTFDFLEPGTYDVSLFSYNSCDTLELASEIVIAIDGATDLKAENFQNLYPNPSSDIVYFELGDEAQVDIHFYDLQGRSVYHQADTYDRSIDISSLPVGQYILKVIGEDAVYSQRIQRIR